MRPLALLLAVLALCLPGTAAAASFGVDEDATKYATDGGARLFGKLRQLGMTTNRVDVLFNANDPTTIQDKPFLDRMLPVAAANGIRIVFAVYPTQAVAFTTDTQTRIALFSAYVRRLAQTYPQVHDFVIGNEPNERRFLQPQFASGQAASAPLYLALLASAYDALKSVDPAINVIGVALSPDGNDTPGADNESISPVRFLAALGQAYRRSGRQAPIMDQLSYHLHPRVNSESVLARRVWPNAGAGDLDRIRQAFWDAFHGTAQPTFPELGGSGIRWFLNELTRQARILAPLASSYSGAENVPVVEESTQAADYADAVRALGCDPSVASLLIFHLVDESNLNRFQSGLLRVDQSERPAFAAVAGAIRDTGSCGAPAPWSHATGVIGAIAIFNVAPRQPKITVFGLTATAEENAFGKAGIFRVTGPSSRVGAAELGRALAGASATRPVLTAEKLVKAQNAPRLELHGKLTPGWYVYAVRLTAELNPQRATTIVSKPFRFG